MSWLAVGAGIRSLHQFTLDFGFLEHSSVQSWFMFTTSVSTNSSSAKFHNCWLVWWRCGGVAVEDLGECKQSSSVTVSPPAAGWRGELQCTAGKWRPLHCYSRALPAADMTTPRNTPHHGHCTGHCTDTGTLSLTMDLQKADTYPFIHFS